MTGEPPGSAPLPQQGISTDPSHRPVLFGAMAASVGTIIGSVGPWFTVMVFTMNGLDAGVAGKTALILGILCCIALVVEYFWDRTNFDRRWCVPIAWAVAVTGSGCFVYSVPFLIKILTIPTQHVLGIPIGAGVGWGLWLLAISSAALCVTATILATQIAKNVELHAALSGKSKSRLINGSRWTAVIASSLIVISAIVNYSVNWSESIGGPDTSPPTNVPSFPSFPSFTMPSFPSFTEPSFPTFTEPSFPPPSISVTPSITADLPTDTTEPSTPPSTGDGSPISTTQASTICRWLHDPAWTLGQIAMSTGDMLANDGADGPGDNVRAIRAAAASTCPDELQRVSDADWN
ncbi:hypothetical protein BH09ACT8_BH09ACT8_30880 [soil metagenome]